MKKLFSSKAARRIILPLLASIPLMATFIYGDNIRQTFNNASNTNTPLEQRDLMTYERSDGDFSAVISARSILKTGTAPTHAFFSPGNFKIGNMNVEWDADDSFVRAFNAIEKTAALDIATNATLQHLKAKSEWTKDDSIVWDGIVAEIIARAINKTPGLDEYRTNMDGSVPPTRHLNALSRDIEKHTAALEFDCEAMSFVKISLQQRMSDRFLSERQKSRYFYVSGDGELELCADAPSGHVFIIVEKNSVVTGVIEATDNSGVFCKTAMSCPFADFATGKPVVTTSGAVYGLQLTHGQADAARQNAGIKTYKEILREIAIKRQKIQQQKLVSKKMPGA